MKYAHLKQQNERLARCVSLLRTLLAQAEGVAEEANNRAAMLELEPCHDSLDEFQKQVGQWAEKTFPHCTVATLHEHLRREAIELQQAIEKWQKEQQPIKDTVIWNTVMEEIADINLLALHLAFRRRFSLFDVIQDKFRFCQTRGWSEPDEQGVSEHLVMNGTAYAPFSQEQIATINAYQQIGTVHPLTCVNSSLHANLVAVTEGVTCPTCGYMQTFVPAECANAEFVERTRGIEAMMQDGKEK